MNVISLSGKALEGPKETPKRDEDQVKDQDFEIMNREGHKRKERVHYAHS